VAEVKWSLNLRIFAMLRRLVVAAEGIESQLRYQNERSFPPVHQNNGGRKQTVFSRKKSEDETI